MEIRPFIQADQQGVIDLILAIQRDEFGLGISIEDQPDLLDIPTFYQVGIGDFLVAETNSRIVGTIGLKDIGSGEAALRKMFVASEYRGNEYGIARKLLQNLLKKAGDSKVRRIFLGTTDKFIAAHRFYEKNGFWQIPETSLPPNFPRMAVDTRFYRLQLDQ